MRIGRIINRKWPICRRFYHGIGLYFKLHHKLRGVEFRRDPSSFLLEAWREFTPDDTLWYFIIWWERKRQDWKVGFESHFFNYKLCLGPLALLIPRNQHLAKAPDH